MKLYSTLAVLAAGASLASAVPLRVVVVESQVLHPVNHNPNVATIHAPPAPAFIEPTTQKKGCRMRMKEKAMSFTNAFRQAFGFDPVPATHESHIVTISGVQMEIKENGEARFKGGERVKLVELPPKPAVNHPHPRPIPMEDESFLRRVQFSLLALGPWEGRAVAFVLGCGIGVLLRMFWVLFVVTYRTIADSSSSSKEQAFHFVDEEDAEEIFVAPPEYTVVYTDEKIPFELEEEDAKVIAK